MSTDGIVTVNNTIIRTTIHSYISNYITLLYSYYKVFVRGKLMFWHKYCLYIYRENLCATANNIPVVCHQEEQFLEEEQFEEKLVVKKSTKNKNSLQSFVVHSTYTGASA